jgi:transposase InsO family protein
MHLVDRQCSGTVVLIVPSQEHRRPDVRLIESFNGKLREKLLNGEIVDGILEARVVTERWRKAYNRLRPHSALGYRTPWECRSKSINAEATAA